MLSSLTLLHRHLVNNQLPIRVEWIHHVQIERLIPIRIQRLLDHRSGMGLFTPNGSHSKGIGESYSKRQSTPLAQLDRKSLGAGTYERHRVCKDRLLR